MMWKHLLAMPLLAAGLLAAPVMADESWDTEFGTAYWDIDMDGQAIFVLPTDTEIAARVYLPGFTPDMTRGVHWGYWILPNGESYCDSEMTGPDGVSSALWGRIQIAFDAKEFPSSWTGVLGRCFEPLEYSVRAVAD